jgi:protein-disulfide isomerase
MTIHPSPPEKTGAPSKGLVAVVGVVATAALALGAIALVVALKGDGDKTAASAPTATVTITESPTQGADTEAAQTPPPLAPSLLEVTGVIVGEGGKAITELRPEPPVRVDLFSDYMCPYCGQFEVSYGETLQTLVDEGKINLVVHPVAILDQLSQGTNYSTRASIAAMTVAAMAPDAFGEFNRELFAQQPAENTEGLADAKIADIAKAAGAPDNVLPLLTNGTDAAAIGAMTQAASEAGMTGTPTIALTGADGQPQRWDYETPIDQLVDQIAGQ